jgi:hypothetical protein
LSHTFARRTVSSSTVSVGVAGADGAFLSQSLDLVNALVLLVEVGRQQNHRYFHPSSGKAAFGIGQNPRWLASLNPRHELMNRENYLYIFLFLFHCHFHFRILIN